jgi:hypothetical protein
LNKYDISLLAVMLAAVAAVYAVWRARQRRAKATARPTAALPSLDATTATEPSVPPPQRALTVRERRREEIVTLAQADRCLYCSAEPTAPLPYAQFTRPSVDVTALLTGDLPKHWRVHNPTELDAIPLVCDAHATIARSAVELRAAKAHAAYAEFVSAQKEEMHEFTAHGLDEQMRAEADRVRKGVARGGAS